MVPALSLSTAMKSPWIRRIAVAIGALLLLLFVAAAVLLATFDANRYKSLAVDWMKTEHQRALLIDGPIELAFLPRLAVKVSRLRISERGRDDEFAAVDEAALAVQVWPLLFKQLVIDRVSARGVRVSFLRDVKGGRNIDDLISAAGPVQTGPAPAGSGSGGAGLGIDLESVRLDDLRLRIDDKVAGLAGELIVQSFTSGRLAAQAPVSLRASLVLSQPQPVKLALDGRMTLTVDPDKPTVTLAGLKLDIDGDAGGLKGLSLALVGSVTWDGNALRAGPLKLALQSATLGSTSLALSTFEVQHALFDPAGHRLELQSLELALAGRQGASPFELTLDWPQLAVDAQQLKGSAVSGRFKLTGPTTRLLTTFRSAAPGGNFDALRVSGLALAFEGQTAERKITGNVKADVLLQPGRGAAALEHLDLRATVTEPGLQALQLGVNGSAGADAKTAHWQLSGALNTNRFNIRGQAAFAGATPQVKAVAHFDNLDMNKLLAPGKPAPTTTTATAPADTAVPLDALKLLNGEFALDAGALALRQYKVADAKLAATLQDGNLRISTLTGRAWGGSFSASGSADANSTRVGVKLDAEGVNVAQLLKDVADKDLLEGIGHVAADLDSSGARIGALRSNLAGTVAVQLRNGAIKGINLARMFRQAQAAMSLRKDAVTQASSAEKTDFSELSASARVAGGVAQSDDLDIKSPFLRIGGAGRFDIGRGRIDYTARATVIASAAGQGGAGLDALRGLAVPVELSGPFSAIDWKIQWSEIAASAVKGRIKDKLVEALGARLGAPAAAGSAASAPVSNRDLLKDRFKGLFK